MSDADDMLTDPDVESERILFLPATPHDADRARRVFDDHHLDITSVDDLSALFDELDGGAGCLLLVEEKLHDPRFDDLAARLERQPTWSDLPLVVVTRPDRSNPRAWHLAEIANVTFAERPLRIDTLVPTLRSALRDRRRQYELRRSIANRDQFLAMLGHELRNPLSAILMAVDQLEDEESDQTVADIIRRQSQNLERLVGDLLEISRISRGVISFDKEPVDMTELVRQTIDAFRPIAADQNLGLHVEVPDDALWVHGDRVRLDQVLGNLVSNAIRYTPEGGDIDVTAGREKDGDEEEVVVSVRDTGPGIDPEMLEHIFELFTQADKDTEHGDGGLGLGLSLAHGIVEEHDGRLVAENNGEDAGSTFTLRLPRDSS